jgi:TPR repeat protein
MMRFSVKSISVCLMLATLAPALQAAPRKKNITASNNSAAFDLKTLKQKAEQGDAEAQFILGVMYDTGEGVPQNYILAHRWFNLFSANATAEDIWENKAKESTPMRDKAAEFRDEVAAKMTPTKIAEAQRQASAWRVKQ